MADIRVDFRPPPPSERPVAELKRRFTASELRSRLSAAGLETRGTKSDLAIRVAHNETVVTVDDIAETFTLSDLRTRLKTSRRNMSKSDLCAEYHSEVLDGLAVNETK